MELETILTRAVAEKATDIHLQSGRPPYIRVGAELQPLALPHIQTADLQAWSKETGPGEAWSFSWKEGIRCRGQRSESRHGPHWALRVLYPLSSLPQEENPVLIQRLGTLLQGLVLVCGATGSGKTTTIWRVLEYINQHRACHIVTLEDPVEYVLEGKKALFTQREVGGHVDSFEEGVRQALRQDPDIMLIGEIRDKHTLQNAITAAETGVLVFSTLHSPSVAGAVSRMVGMFAAGEQEEIRQRLAAVLASVVAQQCFRDKNRMHIVRELLWRTPAAAQVIRSGKEFHLTDVMQTGGEYGMETMAQALKRYRSGI